MRRIYVASSWRNPIQPLIVDVLRGDGHQVYDFRNPAPGNNGFRWSEIDSEWLGWTPETFIPLLDHEIAIAGFELDWEAMNWADTFVLVLPCGRSAHLEAGWALGAGKLTALLLHEDGFEPELMYRMADLITHDVQRVREWLR